MLGIDTSYAPRVSAKEGIGTEDVLRAIVDRLPPPKGNRDGQAEGTYLRFSL